MSIMQSGRAELQKKVSLVEAQGLKRNEALLSRVSSLDDFLEAAYSIRLPGPHDYENRHDLIRICNDISRDIHGTDMESPVVEEFGSFLMNMFTPDNDLDLSINFNGCAVDLSRKAMQKILRKFANKFKALQRRGIVRNVQLILSARVPVLKVTDCGTDIECDFSVENRDGVAKSLTVFMIAAIDERFRKLSMMLKAWAKTQGINCSREGTLNSMSLISLAAFHLQRSEPPILPPFSAILRGGCDPQSVEKSVSSFLSYGQKNNDSLARLFVTLLIRLQSVETLWAEGLCSSVYEGAWICKTANKFISVEDFTDRSQNVARAVGPKQFPVIYRCIEKSLLDIRNFVDGKIDVSTLESLLFGLSPPRMTKRVKNYDCPVLLDPTPTKKIRSGAEKRGRVTSHSKKGGKKKKQGKMAKKAETLGTMGTNPTQYPCAAETAYAPVAFQPSSQSVFRLPPPASNLSSNPAFRPVTEFPRAPPNLSSHRPCQSATEPARAPNHLWNPSSRPFSEFPRVQPSLSWDPPSRPPARFPHAQPNPSWNTAPRPAIHFSHAQFNPTWNPPVAGFSHARPNHSWNPPIRSVNEFPRAPPNPSWNPPPQPAFEFRARPNPSHDPYFPPRMSHAPYSGQVNTGRVWSNNPTDTPGGARRYL